MTRARPLVIVSVVALILLAVGAVAQRSGLIGPSWVRFQSSDGEWADSTVPMKGRNFDVVLRRFQEYQRSCGAQDAQLQRITPRPKWWQVEHWLNDYDDPEWQVAYATAMPKTASGHYPPASAAHCANGGSPPNSSPTVIRSFDDRLAIACSANPDVKLRVVHYGALPEGAVLLVEYPAVSGNPAARDVWCDTERTDWSAGRALGFQVNPTRDMRLSVSFMDRNRVAYTSWTTLEGHSWQKVRIPFDAIRPNPYFQPPDAKIGAPLDVSEVRRIGFAPQDPEAGYLSIARFVVDY
jgi:hypothetical protein